MKKRIVAGIIIGVVGLALLFRVIALVAKKPASEPQQDNDPRWQ
ncbi:MAG: hypothetical protein ACUVWA_07790 [Candidatus Oleimicrobiaceae bacterium]